jgi:hypothetical protein
VDRRAVLFAVESGDPPHAAIPAVKATTTSNAITRRTKPEAISRKTLRPQSEARSGHRKKRAPRRDADTAFAHHPGATPGHAELDPSLRRNWTSGSPNAVGLTAPPDSTHKRRPIGRTPGFAQALPATVGNGSRKPDLGIDDNRRQAVSAACTNAQHLSSHPQPAD